MLKPRLIPCLLLSDGELVKTTNFKNPYYVGDPLNAVRIFNEKKVDELIVLDIDASIKKKSPNFQLIKKIAAECRMPLCYGGGVNNLKDVIELVHNGVEKVAINSIALKDTSFIKKASQTIGSQSIVVVLDVKKIGLMNKKYSLFFNSATKQSNWKIEDYILEIQEQGAGEVLINSIDRDGTMLGYDYKLVDLVFEKLSIPITILGGASSLSEFKETINRYGIVGMAAGSLFCFKGKYKAVLLQYPTPSQKDQLY